MSPELKTVDSLLSPKERYNLKIEQIIASIYDLRHRYSKPINEILEDISIKLELSKFIKTDDQSSLFQFENSNIKIIENSIYGKFKPSKIEIFTDSQRDTILKVSKNKLEGITGLLDENIKSIKGSGKS